MWTMKWMGSSITIFSSFIFLYSLYFSPIILYSLNFSTWLFFIYLTICFYCFVDVTFILRSFPMHCLMNPKEKEKKTRFKIFTEYLTYAKCKKLRCKIVKVNISKSFFTKLVLLHVSYFSFVIFTWSVCSSF